MKAQQQVIVKPGTTVFIKPILSIYVIGISTVAMFILTFVREKRDP